MALKDQIDSDAARQSVEDRFFTAQSRPVPDSQRLSIQNQLQEAVKNVAFLLELHVADSRLKSLALTHLEETLMWGGKAIFS